MMENPSSQGNAPRKHRQCSDAASVLFRNFLATRASVDRISNSGAMVASRKASRIKLSADERAVLDRRAGTADRDRPD